MKPELYAALASGAIAVTPNRRLARHLQRDFSRDALAQGRKTWATPTILPYAAWLESLRRTAERLALAMRRELRAIAIRVEGTERRLALVHPGVRLEQQTQRLDDLTVRLGGATQGRVQRERLRRSIRACAIGLDPARDYFGAPGDIS